MRATACFMLVAALGQAPALASEPAGGDCADTDKACIFSQMHQHAVRRAATWDAERSRPLPERVRPAPAMLVEYLNLDNRLNDFPDRPRTALPDAAFMADLHDALAELPPQVRQLVDGKLVGIYLVEGLGGTGFTDVVEDSRQEAVGGYIVLDAGVLSRLSANAWATWKENTPFRPQEGYKLDTRIETGAQDGRKNAIQYILLHELAHVFSIGGNVHPPWTVDPKDVQLTMQYRFFLASWRIDRWHNRYTSEFDADFPQRTKVVYYFGAKLDAADMVPTYANLEKTNFASLYGATRPGDDFAEAFASYVHVVLMKRPWQITISHPGEPPKVFRACWDEPRCRAKRELLEGILGRRD
ncbi:MAG: hypothetical protein ACXWJM_12845 [Ramlibacter sp.]